MTGVPTVPFELPQGVAVNVLPTSGSVIVWQMVTKESSGTVFGVFVTTGGSGFGVTVIGVFDVSHKPLLSQTYKQIESFPTKPLVGV